MSSPARLSLPEIEICRTTGFSSTAKITDQPFCDFLSKHPDVREDIRVDGLPRDPSRPDSDCRGLPGLVPIRALIASDSIRRLPRIRTSATRTPVASPS